jgi:signal transduction histidine kinase
MNNLRILLIDDSKSIHIYFKELLNKIPELHLEFKSLLDPKNAIETAREFIPDVVITDLEMPTMTGYQLCEQFKSHPNLKTIPVVVLTSSEGDDKLIKAIEAGADDFLVKKGHSKVVEIKIKAILRNIIVTKEVNREKENQLLHEKQQILLHSRLNTIGQMTTQLAHDLANIVMIMNAKSLILEKSLIDPSNIKHNSDIRQAGVLAQDLIKKILAYSRVQDNKLVLFKPYIALKAFSPLLSVAVSTSIDLKIETDHSDACIEADSSDFNNAIMNLCINARDAMPLGGKISIATKATMRNEQNYVAVSVKDNGSGIPESIKEKIFSPFFTTKADGKGTGLGLSQIQEFVKRQEGYIDLESSPEGTCFTLLLPAKN